VNTYCGTQLTKNVNTIFNIENIKERDLMIDMEEGEGERERERERRDDCTEPESSSRSLGFGCCL
jgi:hypothetical protein